ncbi:MAG: hypothetical protein ACM3X9_08020 [Bacillota bacterium]
MVITIVSGLMEVEIIHSIGKTQRIAIPQVNIKNNNFGQLKLLAGGLAQVNNA